MAVTVRSATTYASAATEASTSGLALPSGWQPGDVIYIACELTAATGSITTPSGWTAVVAQFVSAIGGTPTSGHAAVYRRVMQSGDTAPTISFTSGRFAAALVAVQGADNTTPEDVTPASDDNTGVTVPSVRAPSLTPVTNNCLLLTFHAVRNLTSGVLTSFTPDASETEQADAGTSVAAASEAAVEAASLALTGTSATGTKTATATGSNVTSLNLMGAAVVVRPAASAAVFVPLQAARRLPYRVQGLPPARRFRQMLPVPAQLNPPYQFTELAQRRETWPRGLPRRARVTFVVPKQLNPPYQFAEIRQWRQPRGFWPRRGHGFMPVPAQQAAAPPPPFVWQPLRHPRLAVFTRRSRMVSPHLGQPEVPRQRAAPHARTAPVRRGRVMWPPQAQAPAAPPAWVQAHRAPLRALALIRRRFAQLLPWPQATAPPPPQFSIGALSASTAPTTTQAPADTPANALTASGGPSGGILTATVQRTGGPG